MHHSKSNSIIFQLVLINILLGYVQIYSQEIKSTSPDYQHSNYIKSANTFSASISGSATYCPNTLMPITLTITDGTQPFVVTLTRSGSYINKDTVIEGITGSQSIIQVNIIGAYTLKSITDDNLNTATISGATVVLSLFTKPSAVLTGGQGICNDGISTAPLSLNLAGKAPWTFTIRRGTSDDTTYTGISADPFTVHARIIGLSSTTYRMISISDANCAGDTANSGTARVFYINSPAAVISGQDTICPSETGKLSVVFSGTAGPWNITYLRNGIDPTVINNIAIYSYDLIVPDTGSYTLSRVQDAVCTGRVTGAGRVMPFMVSATISGTATICDDTVTNLNIALIGTAPWKFSFLRNNEDPIELNNIITNSTRIPVKLGGTYTLKEVFDKHCKGTVSGSATIKFPEIPTATILGSATICEYTVTDLNIFLGGNPPWSFSYLHNNIDTVEVVNIDASPYKISIGQEGIYRLHEVFDKYCQGTVIGSAVISVIPAPDVSIIGLASAYDKQTQEWIPIAGIPSGGYFRGGLGFTFFNNTWYLLPMLFPLGTNNIVYAYEDPISHCTGYDTTIVRILEADAHIGFPEGRTKYCKKEGPFSISGANLINVIGTFSISGGIGLTDNGDNTATIDPSLLVINEYTITYTYFDGTNLSVTSEFEIHGPKYSNISVSKCESYTSPSGKYKWITSGTYIDTISNIIGCDSIITINLNVSPSSRSTIDRTACKNYISPSGKYNWTSSGAYKDTIPNHAGCDSIISINLIIQTIDISVTQNANTLTANAAGANYQWVDCSSNELIVGENNRSFIATSPGEYALIVTQNGCQDTSTCYSINLTGLTLNKLQQNIIIYPNPNMGSFSINLGKVYSDVDLTITELDGRLIQKDFYSNIQEIELLLLAKPGFYLLVIYTENEKAVFSILKY